MPPPVPPFPWPPCDPSEGGGITSGGGGGGFCIGGGVWLGLGGIYPGGAKWATDGIPGSCEAHREPGPSVVESGASRASGEGLRRHPHERLHAAQVAVERLARVLGIG